ncbi:putative Kinase [Quillaja saponaria]|uniref:Kinase n=1 Tax=Quillaja saponaria TaxID=32244 RepID=A0AAD7KMY4_QUISA|nr:putative Kinase [Quillaja saponaria]
MIFSMSFSSFPSTWFAGFIALLIIVLFQDTCHAKATSDYCAPSSCGKLQNISYPFRLKGDNRKNCGDQRYELACESNVTVLNLFLGKFYVQAINYGNYTIRLVDPGVHNQESDCSSVPHNFVSKYSFENSYNLYVSYQDLVGIYVSVYKTIELLKPIIYLRCTNPVLDDARYVDTSPCIRGNSDSKGHTYAILEQLLVKDLKVGCQVKLISQTFSEWWVGKSPNNVSYTDIHERLVYGFELSWMDGVCEKYCGKLGECSFNITSKQLSCYDLCRFEICGIWSTIFAIVKEYFRGFKYGLSTKRYDDALELYKSRDVGILTSNYVLSLYIEARFLLGISFLIGLLVYKWRRRHLSMYENIENFLQDNNNNLIPIRYSYREIKTMTGGFKDKLGEGGFGCVYKGKLRSGLHVAVKMLSKSKNNRQDFISEVATIGRIHHVNVVQLVGFCVEGTKRALVYEFMPNGSLEKYIFSLEGTIPLSC